MGSPPRRVGPLQEVGMSRLAAGSLLALLTKVLSGDLRNGLALLRYGRRGRIGAIGTPRGTAGMYALLRAL